jgi:hypothetical protein
VLLSMGAFIDRPETVRSMQPRSGPHGKPLISRHLRPVKRYRGRTRFTIVLASTVRRNRIRTRGRGRFVATSGNTTVKSGWIAIPLPRTGVDFFKMRPKRWLSRRQARLGWLST